MINKLMNVSIIHQVAGVYENGPGKINVHVISFLIIPWELNFQPWILSDLHVSVITSQLDSWALCLVLLLTFGHFPIELNDCLTH